MKPDTDDVNKHRAELKDIMHKIADALGTATIEANARLGLSPPGFAVMVTDLGIPESFSYASNLDRPGFLDLLLEAHEKVASDTPGYKPYKTPMDALTAELMSVCVRIQGNAERIPVRVNLAGEWQSKYLSEMPAQLAVWWAIQFVIDRLLGKGHPDGPFLVKDDTP